MRALIAVSVALQFVLANGAHTTLKAQNTAAPPTAPAPNATRAVYPDVPTDSVPLEVQVVISRWQGDKKVGSLPYTMIVNATPTNGPTDLARLRMGAEIPILPFKATTVDGQQVSPGGQVQYKPIGTNIDCTAQLLADRRYRLQITVEDSSVYFDDRDSGAVASAATPAFRSFRFSNTATLRDGQTTQFTAAADKVSGEIVKVDVTMKVVK